MKWARKAVVRGDIFHDCRHGGVSRPDRARRENAYRGYSVHGTGAVMRRGRGRFRYTVVARRRSEMTSHPRAISRRRFLQTGAAATLAAGISPASPLGLPIGSQTYPHRQRIKDGDFAGLCKDMKALGVGILELCSPGYAEFNSLADGKQTRKIIEDHGL